MKVLWFANTPGLGQHYLNLKSVTGGWITSLQAEMEKSAACTLGFAFYSDKKIAPFEFNGTSYFPVQRVAHHKRKRFYHRIAGKTEYDENINNFLNIVESFKPDIIHIHGTENSFGLILNFITTIPIVITIQGNLTVYAKKYFSGTKKPGIFSQLVSGNPFFTLDFKQFARRSGIEKEILKKAKYIFGRTDWDRRICQVLAHAATYFHMDEVMRPTFYEMQWHPPKNLVPVFFTTSSNSLYKGFEMIIETALLLVKQNIQFNWLVAGLTENDPLVRLIKKSTGVKKLEEINIRLLGQLSEQTLSDQLMHADVYVQVSHIENSPNSICEAMLLGMPIIASFAGGTSSLLVDGKTGVLVQDGDPYALAGALIEMVASALNATQLASEARTVAHKRHNKADILSHLLFTYGNIIKTHHAQQFS